MSRPASRLTGALLAVAAASLLATSWPAASNPPPWAPAHGWRKKHDPNYQGYTGQKWPQDYGVMGGQCNTQAVMAVAGAAVGGVVGSQIGKGDGRTIAIIVGTALGAVIGAKIGRDMDETDRACIGHTLELGPDARPVAWVNPSTGVSYTVTPLRAAGDGCREFRTQARYQKKTQSTTGRACRRADGSWAFAG